jgi:hypothetical protein
VNQEGGWSNAIKLLGAQVIESNEHHFARVPDNQVLAGDYGFPASQLVWLTDLACSHHRRKQTRKLDGGLRFTPNEFLLNIGLGDDERSRADAAK